MSLRDCFSLFTKEEELESENAPVCVVQMGRSQGGGSGGSIWVKGGACGLTLRDSIYMSGFVLEFQASPCICRQRGPRGHKVRGA